MVIATETPVRTSIPDPSRPDDPTALLVVDEVLLAEGLEFSRVPFTPLMDNNMTERGLESTLLGRVNMPAVSCGFSSLDDFSRQYLRSAVLVGAAVCESSGNDPHPGKSSVGNLCRKGLC